MHLTSSTSRDLPLEAFASEVGGDEPEAGRLRVDDGATSNAAITATNKRGASRRSLCAGAAVVGRSCKTPAFNSAELPVSTHTPHTPRASWIEAL